jgi:hypothetical protein
VLVHLICSKSQGVSQSQPAKEMRTPAYPEIWLNDFAIYPKNKPRIDKAKYGALLTRLMSSVSLCPAPF